MATYGIPTTAGFGVWQRKHAGAVPKLLVPHDGQLHGMLIATGRTPQPARRTDYGMVSTSRTGTRVAAS